MKFLLAIVVVFLAFTSVHSYSVLLRAYLNGNPPSGSGYSIANVFALALDGPKDSAGNILKSFATFNSVAQSWDFNIPSTPSNRFELVNKNGNPTGSTINDFPTARVSVTYTSNSGNCTSGSVVDLITTTGAASNVRVNLLGPGGWWVYTPGGPSVTSTNTIFPVGLDVDDCNLSTLRVTLVRADGSEVSQDQAVSVPFHNSSTTTTVLYNINVGSLNQIQGVKVTAIDNQTPARTCRLVRLRVETQPSGSPAVYSCWYYPQGITLAGVSVSYFYTNPTSWIQLSGSSSSSVLNNVNFKCVINSDFC